MVENTLINLGNNHFGLGGSHRAHLTATLFRPPSRKRRGAVCGNLGAMPVFAAC
jgi:hypothetical protein